MVSYVENSIIGPSGSQAPWAPGSGLRAPGNREGGSVPALVLEPRIDIYASWEDIMALSRLERGELAEARLAAKLIEMGIIVAKPLGKAAKWDLIVEAGGKISRLQVKSAWKKTAWANREPAYVIATGPTDGGRPHHWKRCYSPKEVDFVIGYVAPEEAWFVFPVRIMQMTGLVIKTDPKWRLARYRERWDLLFPKGQRRGVRGK